MMFLPKSWNVQWKRESAFSFFLHILDNMVLANVVYTTALKHSTRGTLRTGGSKGFPHALGAFGTLFLNIGHSDEDIPI